jgi:hypothetical protein
LHHSKNSNIQRAFLPPDSPWNKKACCAFQGMNICLKLIQQAIIMISEFQKISGFMLSTHRAASYRRGRDAFGLEYDAGAASLTTSPPLHSNIARFSLHGVAESSAPLVIGWVLSASL